MEIIDTIITEVKILKPKIFEDSRGYFYEAYNINDLQKCGINFSLVQENCAFSLHKGIVRGLHFQNNPMAQAKIVRCSSGKVLDYAVDLRKGSFTYLQHIAVELSADNKIQLYIPRGFGHAVISLEENSMIEYVADNRYSPEHDRSIRCTDEALGLKFPFDNIILSNKDSNAPLLKESDCNFRCKEI